MNAGKFLWYNNQFFENEKPIITADNRSLKYGDGLFETMQFFNGEILLGSYHFERLFSSMKFLKFNIPQWFTADYLSDQIKNLVQKNKHQHARIRLNVFRSNENLFNERGNTPEYIIQSSPIEKQPFFNTAGFNTDIYLPAKKTCDVFSHIKTNNYLPYLMAAMWAKENNLNDAILLNNYNRIADATIATVFLVTEGKVKTPALTEGCIDGVMRRHVLESLKKENIPFEETQLTVDELFEANEIFLTNSIQGIKWVEQCRKHTYSFELSDYLHKKYILSFFKRKKRIVK